MLRRLLRRVVTAEQQYLFAPWGGCVAATSAASQPRRNPGLALRCSISTSTCVLATHKNNKHRQRSAKQNSAAAAAKARAAAAAAAAEDAKLRKQERRAARRKDRMDLRRHFTRGDDVGAFSRRRWPSSSSRNARTREWAREVLDDELFESLYDNFMSEMMDGGGGGRGRGAASSVKYKHRPGYGGNPHNNKKKKTNEKNKKRSKREQQLRRRREEMENNTFDERQVFFFGGWMHPHGGGAPRFRFEQRGGFYYHHHDDFTRNTPSGEEHAGDMHWGWRASSSSSSSSTSRRTKPWRRDSYRRREEEEEEEDMEDDFDWMRFEEFVFNSRGDPQFHEYSNSRYHRQHQQQDEWQQQQNFYPGGSGGGGGGVSSPKCPDCSVLGIAPGLVLTEKMLKDALRTQAMKWHPDKYPAEEKADAELKFKRAYNAYDTLLAKL